MEEEKMIQVKLAPLPVPSGAWSAHFQYGGFGIKEDGAYQSGGCVLTPEQANVILTSNKRSVSYRYGSAEAYFQEDGAGEDLLFGGQCPFPREAVLALLEDKVPVNPEFQAAAAQELAQAGAIWEKRHKDFAAQKEGKAPETLVH